MALTPPAPEPGLARRAGVLIPLFSIRSARSWGIGEFPDLVPFAGWLMEAGQTILQLLPLGETASFETSPYGGLTAFGLDPTYLALEEVEDFAAVGLADALGEPGVEDLARVRLATKVDYRMVRALKRRALRAAYEHFRDCILRKEGSRARAFRAFCEEQRSWLVDYALFRALRGEHQDAAWSLWPTPLRDRQPEALAEALVRLADQVRFYEYVQWLCDTQLREARRGAAARGVLLKGDLPFMVSGDSADAWAHRAEFRLDVRLGAPPDQFNAEGQDWGLPVYNWEEMGARNLDWIRRRAARAAELYDLFRLDHVVGFYRQFVIPPGQKGSPVPPDEAAQLELGEQVLSAMLQAAAAEEAKRPAPNAIPTIVAEDLGVVPPYVRRSLTGLGIPGTKVLRWEKDGAVFRDPAHYPALSLCTSGTHDTATLAAWYEEIDEEERRALFAIPALAPHAASAGDLFTTELHGALEDALYGSGSALCILPVQDLLGDRERVNTPSTVSGDNWVYRLPLTVEEMRREPGVQAQMERAHRLCLKHGRVPSRQEPASDPP